MGQTHRVVVTGIGLITPIGKNVAEFTEGLRTGRNGISKLTRVDDENIKAKVAAEITDYDAEQYFDRKAIRRMDRFTQFARIAAAEAVLSSGIEFDKLENTDRAGIYLASGVGGIETLARELDTCNQKGSRFVSPFMIPMMIINMAAGDVAIKYRLHGSSLAIVTACASGTHAIGEAFRSIKHGYHDIMLAGGSEAAIHEIAIAGFQNMTALSLSEDVNAASLPFDRRRNGFVLGEGGAILVMESLENAQKRGAKILGEVCGYGSTTDAFHITSPDPDGAGSAKAMQLALDEAGIKPEQIDYINAHGTGTPVNDKFETKAVWRIFGDHTPKIKVNSTKSMTGHLLGATGTMEAAATFIQMNEGFLHPTINLKEQDEECNLTVVKETEKADINYAVSNSLGFGGHNASIVLKKF